MGYSREYGLFYHKHDLVFLSLRVGHRKYLLSIVVYRSITTVVSYEAQLNNARGRGLSFNKPQL